MGKIKAPTQGGYLCSVTTNEELNLDESIKKFWEIESSFETKKGMTVQETDVEKFFEARTTRDENGRFIVRLPFVNEKSTIGQTKKIAESGAGFRCFSEKLE